MARRLIRSLISDSFISISRLYSYLYWNAHGVRVTPDCTIDIRAQIANTCSLFGKCVVTRNASIDHYSYATSAIIENVSVGKFCSIAPGCILGPKEHPTHLISTHPLTYDKTAFSDNIKKANIGSDVWLGAYVVVLAGVEIPDGCVVAAGAVVTKSIEPFTIVGGVPAHVIGKRHVDRRFVDAIAKTNDPREIKIIAEKMREYQNTI